MTERQKKLRIKRKSESMKKKKTTALGMIVKEGFKTVVYDEHGKAIGEQG